MREQNVREWAVVVESDWYAILSNASLREAFHRTLADAVSGCLGVPTGHGLLDIKGFHDAIEWDLLLHAALRLEYPPVVLPYMELAQCSAPLTLEQFGAVCDPFQVTRFHLRTAELGET